MDAGTKNLLTSKTFWGLVVAVAAPLATRYGFKIDEAGFTNDLVTAFGFILAVYGRVSATKTIG